MAFKRLEIDTFQFKLYYRHTVFLLIFFSVILYLHSVHSSPTVCISKVPIDDFINGCNRFRLYRSPTQQTIRTTTADFDNMVKFSAVYDYTFILLLLQAAMFLVPRYIWNYLEGGTLNKLLNKMNECTDEDDPRIMDAAKLFFNKHKNGQHNCYYWNFICCEFLNCINNIIQVLITSYFLDFDFLTYGLRYSKPEISEKMKDFDLPDCFYCFMPGDITVGLRSSFGICVVPVNELNEKLYFVLWTWFVFIGSNSIVKLFTRFSLAIGPYCLRIFDFEFDLNARYSYFFLVPTSRIVINGIFLKKYCTVGDLFVLNQISKNIYRHKIFQAFLNQVNACWEEENHKMREMRRHQMIF